MTTLSSDTPLGPARVHLSLPAHRAPWLTVVLGHGAGAGSGTRDLVALAEGLPAHGIGVVRVDQPWVVAGRRLAGPPASLDVAWSAVLTGLRADLPGPWVLGGRSAGARVACRTAAAYATEWSVVGVLALAFPLVAPRRRAATTEPKTRLPELLAVPVPTLVVQGERDAFGSAAALRAAIPPAYTQCVVHEIAGADHSFRVTRAHDATAMLAEIVAAVADWGESLPGLHG